MRRTILIAVCGAAGLAAALAVAVGFATAPATAGAAVPAAAAGPKVGVKLLSCLSSDHSAVFQGRMPRIEGAESMAQRYTLMAKLPGAQETRVHVPGLGRWHHSKPGVGAFSFKQEVLNLTAGGAYRMRVQFRWFGPAGEVLRSKTRRSPPCRQSLPLPNLRVELAGVRPTKTDGVWRYWVRVGNSGQGSASNVDVRLSVDGSVVDVETLPALGPGVWTPVIVRGPACQRSVVAEVDPDAAVAESVEGDNRVETACADLVRK